MGTEHQFHALYYIRLTLVQGDDRGRGRAGRVDPGRLDLELGPGRYRSDGHRGSAAEIHFDITGTTDPEGESLGLGSRMRDVGRVVGRHSDRIGLGTVGTHLVEPISGGSSSIGSIG